MPFVAVVDDDRNLRRFLCAVAEHAGYAVGEFVDGQDFLDRYEPQLGCVLLGLYVPGVSCFGVLTELRKRAWKVPVVTVGGSHGADAVARGALAHLPTPFTVADLLDVIERAVTVDAWERRAQEFQRTW